MIFMTTKYSVILMINVQLGHFNPLSPKSDRHQISPYNYQCFRKQWSWELSIWSGRMSLIDPSTNSPHYLYWKLIGTRNENLIFDVRVKIFGLLASVVSPCLVTTLAEIKPTSHQFICLTQRKLTFSSVIETVFLIL